jgi:hypothetical protein
MAARTNARPLHTARESTPVSPPNEAQRRIKNASPEGRTVKVKPASVKKWVASQAPNDRQHYWKNLETDLERLPKTSDVGEQMRIIRHVSDDLNLPYLASTSGNATSVALDINGGNCGNATVATMFTLANGRPMLPVS